MNLHDYASRLPGLSIHVPTEGASPPYGITVFWKEQAVGRVQRVQLEASIFGGDMSLLLVLTIVPGEDPKHIALIEEIEREGQGFIRVERMRVH